MNFTLPEIGEGVGEGELMKWLVKNGDTVATDQPILEVMTDKATVEIPSPVSGKITGIVSKVGDMIKVGGVLAQIEASNGSAVKVPATATMPAAPQTAAAQIPAVPPQGAQAYDKKSSAPSFVGASFESGAPYRSATETHAPSATPAVPIVRAMAQKSGVDLSMVSATGPEVGGKKRVLEEDLLAYLARSSNGASAPSSNFAPPVSYSQETERKPLRGLRRVIAQAMVKSKYTAPHYSYVDEFECTALVNLREEAKKIGEKLGVKISYLPFIVKALVGALKEFPVVNSSLEEGPAGAEIVFKKFYHIGVAVATPDGLVVPVIKNADKKTLLEIAREIHELSEKVRAGKATGEELKGSTFSITSMGNIGGLFATPIINYPEVGILGVYKIQEKPIVKDGAIVVGKTMHLSLSLDHRVVDGAVGGYFCNALIERLSNPARLLMDLT